MGFLPKLSKKDNYSSGQALLLILLAMAVVLTIVLSISSRTITDIAVTTRTEEALRAFSAAEAGIERALVIGSTVADDFDGEAAFSAEVSGFAEGSDVFVNPVALASGESAIVWFVNHNDDGTLVCSIDKPCFTGDQIRICWGRPGTSGSSSQTPAIEVAVVYANDPDNPYTTLRIARGAYDPNSSRRGTNNFSEPSAGNCPTLGGESFQFQRTITFSGLGIPEIVRITANGLQFARVTLLYNTGLTHKVGAQVLVGSPLPSQGLRIDSTGTAGQANRKVQVFQGHPEPPPVFNNAIFTFGGLSK